MPRTSRLPEYQAFTDAVDYLNKNNVDYVKYDNYVLVKRNVWDAKVENVKRALTERETVERAIYGTPN